MTVPCLVHEALERSSVLHQAMERSIAYIFHAVLHLTAGFQDHRQPLLLDNQFSYYVR